MIFLSNFDEIQSELEEVVELASNLKMNTQRSLLKIYQNFRYRFSLKLAIRSQFSSSGFK